MSGVGNERKHLGENAWREVLRRFDASGLGVTAFCRQEGVGVGSLRLWGQRLKTSPMSLTANSARSTASVDVPRAPSALSSSTPPSTPRPAPPPPPPPKPTASVTPKFIELGPLGQAGVGGVGAGRRLEIKLDLGDGLTLHLVRG